MKEEGHQNGYYKKGRIEEQKHKNIQKKIAKRQRSSFLVIILNVDSIKSQRLAE